MLKITSNGSSANTRVIDEETGVDLTHYIHSIEWKCNAGRGIATVHLELGAMVDVEIEGNLVSLAKQNLETGGNETLV